MMSADVSGAVLACLFFPSGRRHTRFDCDWSSDVCSSDLKDDSVRAIVFRGAGTDAFASGADISEFKEHRKDTATALRHNAPTPAGPPAARLGIIYGADNVGQLVDLVGPAYAKDILYSARTVDDREALAMGFIQRLGGPPPPGATPHRA